MLSLGSVAAEDFESMADLRAEALRESLERLGRFDPARVRERLRSAFEPACMRHILIKGERVGYLTLIPHTGSNSLRLHHLYIHPASQGHGVGAWALEWVKAQGRAAGQDITLGALRGSDANRFYLRHGFRLVEEQEFDLEYRWSPEFDARTAEVAP